MEKADGPVGCDEGERHQGVVHQGEPGHFFALSVIFVKQQMNYKDRQVTSHCQMLRFQFSLGSLCLFSCFFARSYFLSH